MISWTLKKLGGWSRSWCGRNPFTNVYGFARTLLAISTAGTIAFNSTRVLFTPAAGFLDVPRCNLGILNLSVFCWLPSHLGLARLICVALLLVVASGWRPRLTAIPHVWVSYSFFASSTIFDGGDQITLVLSVLLLPLALLDSRRWHWSETISLDDHGWPGFRLVAWSAVLMIRIQVAAVYFISGMTKLTQAEWANGTAMYYWLLSFGGTPHWAVRLVSRTIFLVPMTWGPVALEVALALGLVLSRKFWRPLLVLGIIFHLLIGFIFDLWSFAIAMIAALILFLQPADEPLPIRSVWRWFTSRKKRLAPLADSIRPNI